MTTYGTQLYINIDPGVLEIVCSFIHPRFKEFLFRKWKELSEEECLYFCETYRYTEIFRYLWEQKMGIIKRQNLWNCWIIKAVQLDMVSLVEFLMFKKRETFSLGSMWCSYDEALRLAQKDNHRIARFMEKYNNLIKIKNVSSFSLRIKNKNRRRSVRSKIFRSQ